MLNKQNTFFTKKEGSAHTESSAFHGPICDACLQLQFMVFNISNSAFQEYVVQPWKNSYWAEIWHTKNQPRNKCSKSNKTAEEQTFLENIFFS